ncbi:MAG: polysaccharide biosynthesis C-terminal domain-containing protein [Dinghuibacter sp.]|nr:polysaccharide biosynthesis C-terminal domain-containing protein [Dinghuibacter sp.]
MSLRKNLYQNFLWRGIYFATVFALNVGIARFYEAGMSGWINFISNNFSLALLIGSLSLETGVTYFGASDTANQGRLAFFSLLWSALVSIIFVFISGLLISNSPGIASKGLISFASVCYVSGILLSNFFMNLFVVRKEYAAPNIILSLFNILLLLCIPGGIFFNIFDKESYLYFFYGVYVLQGLALVIAYMVMYGFRNWAMPGSALLKKLFRYSFIALAGNLVFFFVYRVDYWFIDYYRNNDAEMGNYIQASKLGQMMLVGANIIAGTVFPQTAGGIKENLSRQIQLISRNLLLLFVVLAVLVFLAGSRLFEWVFGDTFNLMFYPFLVLLPGIYCLSVLLVLSAYFGGINRPGVNVAGALCGLAVIVAGDLLLIPRMGITGAALVSTLGYAVCMGYSLIVFNKINHSGWLGFFTLRRGDQNWLKKLLSRPNERP